MTATGSLAVCLFCFPVFLLLEAGREGLRTNIIRFLAIRRMGLYMMSKVKGKFFAGPLHHHFFQPKGRKLEFGFALIPEQGVPLAKTGSEKMARESLSMLMDGLGSEELDKLLLQNSSKSAEALLLSPAMDKLIEWSKCLEKLQQEQADKAAAHVKETGKLPTPDPAPEDESAGSQSKDTQPGKEETADKVEAAPVEPEPEHRDEIPDLPDGNLEGEEVSQIDPVWETAFKHLVLPETMVQTLKSVTPDVFWNLHSFATARVLAISLNFKMTELKYWHLC